MTCINGKSAAISMIALSIFGLAAETAQAQSGGMFTPPGAMGGIEHDPIDDPSKAKTDKTTLDKSAGDYTDDEKRVQKKYRGKIAHAKDLINQGDNMMKGAKGNTNNKDYKKGKILKEIGEKTLADLEANNPFPEKEKPGKAGKGKGKGDDKAKSDDKPAAKPEL